MSPVLYFCDHEEKQRLFPKLVVTVVELQCFALDVKCYLVEFEAFGALSGAVGVARHGKGKGKAVPLQAWSGPEGSRKLRFPDFMTTAQDGGKVVSLTHRPPLPSGNTPGTHFC